LRKVKPVRKPDRAVRFATENDYVLAVNNKGDLRMSLSAPTRPVFLISLILAILALLGILVAIPVISPNAYWLAILAYIVLALGNVMKGM
jgi:hypothetical protein